MNSIFASAPSPRPTLLYCLRCLPFTIPSRRASVQRVSRHPRSPAFGRPGARSASRGRGQRPRGPARRSASVRQGPSLSGNHHAFSFESTIDQLGQRVLGFGNAVGAHGVVMVIACLLCPGMLQRSVCSGTRLSRVCRKVGERSIRWHHCRKHAIRNDRLRGSMDSIHFNRSRTASLQDRRCGRSRPSNRVPALVSIQSTRSAATFRMFRRSG